MHVDQQHILLFAQHQYFHIKQGPCRQVKHMAVKEFNFLINAHLLLGRGCRSQLYYLRRPLIRIRNHLHRLVIDQGKMRS